MISRRLRIQSASNPSVTVQGEGHFPATTSMNVSNSGPKGGLEPVHENQCGWPAGNLVSGSRDLIGHSSSTPAATLSFEPCTSRRTSWPARPERCRRSWSRKRSSAAEPVDLVVSDQSARGRRVNGSPGARMMMRSGFSTRPGSESGSALNGGKSGASTQPQWYSSSGVCG